MAKPRIGVQWSWTYPLMRSSAKFTLGLLKKDCVYVYRRRVLRLSTQPGLEKQTVRVGRREPGNEDVRSRDQRLPAKGGGFSERVANGQLLNSIPIDVDHR